MPRWVEHESEDEAASTSDEEDAGQEQLALAQQTAKRKAAAPEAGPSSNKKVKLSISLSRAKLECHVRRASCYCLALAPLLTKWLQLAGLRAEGPLCRLCRLSVSGLSQQALLPVQEAWAHYHDLPIQDCTRAWLHAGCLNFRRHAAESSTEKRARRQVCTTGQSLYGSFNSLPKTNACKKLAMSCKQLNQKAVYCPCSTSRIPVEAPTQWQVDTAVLRLHSRRCTCLEFHPTRDNIVLSGDKKGQVAIWDHAKVYDRTVYNLNRALTNNLRFLPGSDGMQCCSASSDGTLKASFSSRAASSEQTQ